MAHDSSDDHRWSSVKWGINNSNTVTTCVNITDIGHTLSTATFTITAPSTAGTYNASFQGFTNSSCTSNPSTVLTLTNSVVVSIPDTTPPVITLTGSNPVIVEGGSVYTDAGATAADNVDGNITSSIVTVNPVNTAVLGTYTVTYNVHDAAGNNATQVTRTVNVVDTTKPVISLNGSNPQVVLVGQAYVEGGATVADNVDSGLSATIDSGAVDTNTLGSYQVTYNAVDNSGNAANQVTRTVNVVDQEAPVITLIGANPQIVEVGTPYAELGATVADNVDNGLSATIDSSAVNTSALGSYQVTYNATDNSENSATQVTRTVNVVDTTKPVISLNGSADMSIIVGGVYTEAGATATDNYDESVDVVTTGSVNTAIIGTYTIYYNATDNSGNVADTVTRTVHVVSEVIDVCSNIEGNQESIPEGKELVEGQCVDSSTNPSDTENENRSGSTHRQVGGSVLGASTGPDEGSTNSSSYCTPFLTHYLKMGGNNDKEDVKKLQEFLNEHQNAGIPVTGFFGELTLAAVKKFQLAEKDYVIAPWVEAGLATEANFSLGYVYKTTLWRINMLKCPEGTSIPKPLIP